MTREWKPGDLITDDTDGVFFIVEVSANTRAAWTEGASAVDADGNGWRVDSIEGARPLVVIDPEDREQVERLARTYCDAAYQGRFVLADIEVMQAALCSLVEPPKPPEPTGLGAVVEDADGSWWVRVNSVHFVSNAHPNNSQTYAEIAAVRVLSEGVPDGGDA